MKRRGLKANSSPGKICRIEAKCLPREDIPTTKGRCQRYLLRKELTNAYLRHGKTHAKGRVSEFLLGLMISFHIYNFNLLICHKEEAGRKNLPKSHTCSCEPGVACPKIPLTTPLLTLKSPTSDKNGSRVPHWDISLLSSSLSS